MDVATVPVSIPITLSLTVSTPVEGVASTELGTATVDSAAEIGSTLAALLRAAADSVDALTTQTTPAPGAPAMGNDHNPTRETPHVR